MMIVGGALGFGATIWLVPDYHNKEDVPDPDDMEKVHSIFKHQIERLLFIQSLC